jgi:hypothetical protein
MPRRLIDGFASWRRLGPRRGTATAAAIAWGHARTPLRRARLRVAPVRARPGAVRAGIGPAGPGAALRGRVLDALPTVRAFEAGLDAQRDHVLAVADRVLAHEFDLLGSGPTDLGPRIDWQRDFKTGRRWPLVHISQVPISYPDASDIKVPWELSRFQHLPVLAAAHRLTGDRRYLDELGAQLTAWIDENPVEYGANWACTMDVAIRAANWIAALALCAEAAEDEPWLDGALASLLLHGRFIRGHLEWAEARGNHYLSDVVGLLPVAALFHDAPEARAWADWAVGELHAELHHQVREDGCDHEMSVPYHRLVTELFVCGQQAADALRPGALTEADHERVRRMLRFAADYRRPDGLTPQLGDNDDGRYLPLGDYGDPHLRSHDHLFAQAGMERPAPRSGGYPHGGYAILRRGDDYAIVRCGDVGVAGLGSHAHNDQLAFDLCLDGVPVVSDPGSYLYTADPAARNAFRGTASHATLRIDGREQNDIDPELLFVLRDQARPRWRSFGDGAFEGEHHGFAPAVHHRRVELGEDGLTVVDTVRSPEAHDLEWTFPLEPGWAARVEAGGVELARDGRRVRLSGEGLAWRVDDGWHSPGYGRRVPTAFVRATGRSAAGEHRVAFAIRRR